MSKTIIDLGGTWQARSTDGRYVTDVQVPGSLMAALERDGIFGAEGLFYRENNRKAEDIARRGFVFSHDVELPADFVRPSPGTRLFLEADGIDTLATLLVNGHEVAHTANMHRRYRFAMDNVLIAGRNHFEIHFADSIDYITKAQAKRRLWHSYWEKPDYATQGFNRIRKSHCSYGWDWGPIVPDVGIWRGLRLVRYCAGRLETTLVQQTHGDSRVALDLSVAVESWLGAVYSGAEYSGAVASGAVASGAEYSGAVSSVASGISANPMADGNLAGNGASNLRVEFGLSAPDGSSIGLAVASIVPDASGRLLLATTRLVVEKPQLWWPNGLGDQPLYVLRVRLLGNTTAVESKADAGIDATTAATGCSTPTATTHGMTHAMTHAQTHAQTHSMADATADARADDILDERSLTIGLRTMAVRRETDQWGQSFALEVNGIPFFARGGDWIPEDVFLTRPTRASTERLIADAVLANFNCLRVWGGGIYPSDDFFDLCDRHGLVVWQDLMFACATYDINNPEFLAEIKAEVADNLERIRHHASLGLVCGNNEMEWGFVDWGIPHTNEQRTEYLRQYQFELPQVAASAAPETFYWPASPSSGGDFDKPNDPDHGDTHFWAVWHGNKDFSEYEKHWFRFMSEFGFESFPNIKTIESFTTEADRNVFSPVMEDHQRCDGGNQKIFTYISKYFRFPKDFAALVYLSQLSQSEAIRHGVEHWRRNRGRCMGAVYWQYNDNWPVASWASVDYYGRWKALHYEARRAFANVLLSCPVDGNHAELHLSNEGRSAVNGRVFWHLSDMAGVTLRDGWLDVAVQPLSTMKAADLDFSTELAGLAADSARSGSLGRERLLFHRFEQHCPAKRTSPAGQAQDAVDDGAALDCAGGGAALACAGGGAALACAGGSAALDCAAGSVTAFFGGGSGQYCSGGAVSFVPAKSLSLRQARITVRPTAGDGRDASGRTVLEVASDVPALFVELDCAERDLWFSDNYFHLDGRLPRTIVVERGSLAPSEIAALIRVRSLRDTY
jgi:beta-mannosidase